MTDQLTQQAGSTRLPGSGTVIDKWFEKISEGLTDKQKADLNEFSRRDALAKIGQAIRASASDISRALPPALAGYRLQRSADRSFKSGGRLPAGSHAPSE